MTNAIEEIKSITKSINSSKYMKVLFKQPKLQIEECRAKPFLFPYLDKQSSTKLIYVFSSY